MKQKPFFQHPFFWSALIITALAAGLFSYYYFSSALPFVDIHITMNKKEALEKAEQIAAAFHIGPINHRSAAYFNTDSGTQNYIELERGGRTAWKEFLKQKEYFPYTWLVRHFKEGDVHEAYFLFTPDGIPYGFIETIAETAPGAALTTDQARARAEEFALKTWKLDITAYTKKDTRMELRPHGRIDHTFVYEKKLPILNGLSGITKKQLNTTPQAHYLVTLVVSGDKVTTLNHSVDLPEIFIRTFENLRSFNDTLQSFASIIAYLLYLLIFCLFGILYLLKIHYLLPRQALIAGIGLAAINFFAELNQLPMLWFSYDTALSATTFLFQNFLSQCITFVWLAALYTTSFVAAEGLTRLAFGSHIQLWSSWKVSVASSFTMLSKTIASYCIMAFDIAFVVLFYGVFMHYWGWWSPSSALTDPNILSTYIPAYDVVATSLVAGFWEEALFRAVPIASFALIGKKLGSRTGGILAGFILQALIFGAAHANYPQIPSYVRVVELFLPSLAYGAIYILFGLIPVVIAHTLYNTFLRALPLFVSSAPGMGFQRFLVLIAFAVPLLIILISRLRTGRWLNVPTSMLNGAWQPITQTLPLEKADFHIIKTSQQPFSIKKTSLLMTLAIAALIFCFISVPLISSWPSLKTTKKQVENLAAHILAGKNDIIAQRTLLPSVSSPDENSDLNAQYTYIWQKYGKEAAKKLSGTYLKPPHWIIRYAQFSGSQEDRAEEFQLSISGTGNLIRTKHILPQAAPGESLDEQEARKIALYYIQDKYGLSADKLVEKAAQSENFPHRRDWFFSFVEPLKLSKHTDTNSARIQVVIAGNKIVDSEQTIMIPEDWSRIKKRESALHQCFATLTWMGWFLTVLLAAFYALLLFRRGQLSSKVLLCSTSAYMFAKSAAVILTMPQTLATFSTAKPFTMQLCTWLALQLAKCLVESCIVGICVGVILSTTVKSAFPQWQRIVTGFVAGCFWFASLMYIQTWVFPSVPWFASYSSASAFIPWLSLMISYVLHYLSQTISMMVLGYISSHMSVIARLLPLMCALFLFTPTEATTLSHWAAAFLIIAFTIVALYLYMLKADPRMIAWVLVPFFGFTLLKETGAAPFPGAYIGCIAAFIFIILLALLLSSAFKKIIQ